MNTVNFLASEPHFVEHLLPVWDALPEESRGQFVQGTVPNSDQLTVVCSIGDLHRTTGPAVYMEHGAGQTYSGRQPSYAGGEGKDNVVLFLNLNRTVQAANEAAYPNAKHVIIGSPKLDTYLARSVPVNDKPVVAFSFHWDCKTLPEMGSAFDEYKETIAALTRKDTLPFEVVIHAHPRGLAHQSAYWRNFSNATVLPAFSDVVNTADIYVVDNSSTLYEWAALDRPVIILNSSKYRRNVNHGLRFWDELPGVVVNKPNDLVPTIKEVIRVDKCKTVRAQSTKRIYPYQGRSAARAAAAILSLLQ